VGAGIVRGNSLVCLSISHARRRRGTAYDAAVPTVRVGLDVAQQRLEFAAMVSRVRLAEDTGFDGVWGFDHFQPMYGQGPGSCFEGWTTLAALAGLTRRIRLGLLVTGNTYRHPSLLAAEAVTVDHASDGRLELSLGAAWFEAEHRALGFEFPPTGERIDRLEEALQVLRLLLTADDVSFPGRHYRLDHATLRPRPVQAPYPPIWIGASGERRMLPLVARYADVWHAYGGVEELARKSRLLDELAESAGRDPAAILRATSLDLSQPVDDIRRDAEARRAAGFGYLVAGWPGEGETRVEEFATRVLPDL
jgi:F420-dependent oxidoreductase-like protein